MTCLHTINIDEYFPNYFAIADYDNTLVINGETYYRESYLKIWDLTTGEIKKDCQLLTHCLELSDLGKMCFYYYENLVGIENTENIEYKNPSQWTTKNIKIPDSHYIEAICDRQKLILTTNEKELQVFNYETKEIKINYQLEQLSYNSTNFSKFVSGHKIPTNRIKVPLETKSYLFSPDGKLLICTFRKNQGILKKDTMIKIWNTETGELIQTLDNLPPLVIISLGINSDGKIIACGIRENKIYVWELNTDLVIHIVNELYPCLISTDGRILVYTTAKNFIIIWDVIEQKVVNTLQGHTSPIYYLAMSEELKFIASYSNDNCIKIWGLKT